VKALAKPVELPAARQLPSAQSAPLALVGFSAVLGQIVLMRELIVVFNGNEISLGIMLVTWLFWTASGSALSSALALGTSHARRWVAALECVLAFSLPPTIWALRDGKTLFQTVPGELVGPVPMLLASLLCLSLFCLVSGALFVVAARMAEQEFSLSARFAAGSAYLLEATGSGLGGIVTSLVLLRFLDAFQIAAVVAQLNVGLAAILLFRMLRKRVAVLAAATLICAVPLLVWIAPSLDRSAHARLRQGFHLLAVRDSIYANLVVTETGTLRSLYDNGAILATAPDESAAEESVHYALLEHPKPRHILLVGGGVQGGIAQALKHPSIQRIDYVELDPALIGLARRYFPAQYAPASSDPRVHFHYADGRSYLRAAGDTYDVILLNVPDPQTAQLNRFYTAEFFLSARAHLAPGGLLAFQLHSSEEAISPELAEFLRCIQRTLQEVFPYAVAIPGDTIHFFAATQPGVLTENPDTLISRLEQRNLRTQYVREYFIPYRMTPDRMAQVQEQLRPLASTPVNRDFAPIAYYFNVVLWSAQFKQGYAQWFQAAAHIPFTAVLGLCLGLLLLVAVLLGFVPARGTRNRCAAAYCAAATGFTLMALQIFVLLAFQSIYGYVYHQLAILIGLCMAGVAMGSWFGIRRISAENRPACRSLAVTQFLLASSAPILMLVFSQLVKISSIAAVWLAAQCVFPALAALCGVLGGYQFCIAAQIYLPGDSSRSKLGTLYALDLLGGCAGALLLSAYLIPVFGFWKTAWLCAAINLAPALLALRVSSAASTSATE
jgi:spermidine synthase